MKQRSMKSDFLLCLLVINISRENVSISKHGDVNVNTVPYLFINDLYPDTGSELQPQ